jgi:Ca2+/Na+ antiporter
MYHINIHEQTPVLDMTTSILYFTVGVIAHDRQVPIYETIFVTFTLCGLNIYVYSNASLRKKDK